MAHASTSYQMQQLVNSNRNITMDSLISLVYFSSDIRSYGGTEDGMDALIVYLFLNC
jgi:hypothetical protein